MENNLTINILIISIVIGALIVLVMAILPIRKIIKYITCIALLCCYFLFWFYINREDQINTANYKGDKYSLYIDWYNSPEYFEENRVIPTYFILKKNDKVYVKYIYRNVYEGKEKLIPPISIKFKEDTIVLVDYAPFIGIMIPLNKDSITIEDIKVKYANTWYDSSQLRYAITIYK